MSAAFLEAVTDSLKLLPFLFATYLLMGLLERATSDRTGEIIRRAGRVGPLWGGLIGVIPQCGLSAAASYFYVGRVITLGTLIAIYLSTSDEMLPIFLAEQVAPLTIVKIMGAKVLISVLSGFAVDAVFRRAAKSRTAAGQTGEMGPAAAAGSEGEMEPGAAAGHGPHRAGPEAFLLEAAGKTIKVFLLIFAVSLVIELAIYGIGIERISDLFLGAPVLGEAIAGLIGLIPNCAASVVITQLYIDGVIGAGPMMSGLLVSAGVGLLVLFKENRPVRRSVAIIAVLYGIALGWGILIDGLGIVF